MHELGAVISVINSVEAFARRNNIDVIDTLVLEIGELSTFIPHYIEAVYPAAVEGTLLENTKLKIEILPGNALCKGCSSVFNVRANNSTCPKCGGHQWELLGGRELLIKEIIVP